MVGAGSRKDEPLVISNTNVFAALGSLRKKKKASDSKSKSSSSSSSSSKRQQQPQEEEQPPVFWAPAPLNAKSWADVEDEDDDDYYATTAPPQSVWAGASAVTAQDANAKESSTPLEESESEEEGLDELDDDIEEEHEHEPEPEPKTPVGKKPAEVVAPKESERQLSKKELKKKELAELEAMLAEFGYNKPEGQDNSHGVAQDKKAENLNGEVDKKENNAPGETKSAKKKKKKDKSSKDSGEQQEQPNGIEIENGTDETIETKKAEEAPAVDVKEKIKKMAAAKKKKSSKEMDAAAKAAASEAAARNAKLAAAKKKEKNHYNQQPMR